MNEINELPSTDPPLWKVVVGFGLSMTAIGCAAMTFGWATAIAVELLIGTAMLSAGLVQAMLAFQSRGDKGGGLLGLSALLFIAGGVYLLVSPIEGVRTVSLMIAVLFVVEGVTKVIWGLRMPTFFNRGLLIMEGIAGSAIGLFFWANWPGDSAWMIGLLVGVRFVLAGLSSAGLGWMMRPTSPRGPRAG